MKKKNLSSFTVMWRMDGVGARVDLGKEATTIVQKIDAAGWERVITVKIVRKVRLRQEVKIKVKEASAF